MEITKMVPVTITVANGLHCQADVCAYYSPLESHGFCEWFKVDLAFDSNHDFKPGAGVLRCQRCLSEFGTGEKPAVVPWEDSNIGDVVRIKRRLVVINQGKCNKGCCFDGVPYCRAETKDGWACDNHPSGESVYFTEVKE